MKKLIIAAAAMLTATLVSGSAFAVTGSGATGVHVDSSTVKVQYCPHRHHVYHHACGGCGVYTYTVRYTGCGCHTCGCGGCGCGGGFFGWLF